MAFKKEMAVGGWRNRMICVAKQTVRSGHDQDGLQAYSNYHLNTFSKVMAKGVAIQRKKPQNSQQASQMYRVEEERRCRLSTGLPMQNL